MQHATLIDIFREVAAHPRPDLLRYKEAGVWRTLSSEEFANRVRRLAAFFAASNVAAGDRAALMSENRPEWPISDYAMQIAGVVDVPVYQTSSVDQIRYLLENSESRIVLVSCPELLEKVMKACARLEKVRRIVVFDPPPGGAAAGQVSKVGSGGPEVITLAEAYEIGEELLRREPRAIEARMSAVRSDDLASIIYTSGTTGDPKGVMLTHQNFCSNVDTCLGLIPFDDSDVAFSFLPLSHVFERTVEYMYLAAGATVAYAESIEKVPDNIIEVRPTVVSSVPRVLEKIHGRILENVEALSPVRRKLFEWSMATGRRRLRHLLAGSPVPWLVRARFRVAGRLVFSKFRKRLGGRIRFLISGGAPLSREISEFFHAAGIPVLEGYGLTETSPVIAVNTLERFRPGTVGPVIPGVEVRIGDDGEILVRGPNVMKGYFGRDDATREAMREGFFATGDIGSLDENGFLTITDRKKDLIITSGGKNVAPQPIENALKGSRYIANAVLIGDRRPFVSALIVPDFAVLRTHAGDGAPARDMPPSEMIRLPEVRSLMGREIDEVNAHLASFEQVKKFTLLPNDFSADQGEITPTLKVRRKVILNRYGAEIEAMYRP